MTSNEKTTAAIVSIILSSIVGSICGAIGKKSQLNGREINLMYGSFQFFYAVCSVILKNTKNNQTVVTYQRIGLSVLNGFFFIGISCYFFYKAFDILPYGDVFAITYSTTFLTSVFIEKVRFNYKLPTLTCISAFISFTGLIMFSQPDRLRNKFEKETSEALQGVAFTIISGVAWAFSFLNLKFMKDIPVCYHWLSFSIGSLSASIPSFLLQRGSLTQCNIDARLTLILASTFWPCAPLTSIIGSQLSLPSIMMLLRLITIAISYLMQTVFLGEALTLCSAVGASAIACGVVIQVVSMYRK